MTLYWLEEHLQHAASWLCSILFSALEHNIFGNVSRLKLPASQLFLVTMFSFHSPLTPEPSPITDPETLMLMMEQMSILFDCVRRSGPSQAELLAELLPQVLLDFFPASDVVNRVISEFISPGQPHPALLAGVLKTIFQAAALQVDT